MTTIRDLTVELINQYLSYHASPSTSLDRSRTVIIVGFISLIGGGVLHKIAASCLKLFLTALNKTNDRSINSMNEILDQIMLIESSVSNDSEIINQCQCMLEYQQQQCQSYISGPSIN